MASISNSRSGRPSNWSLPSTSNTWPPQRLARLLQLLQELVIHIAFAGLFRNEVPQVADLGLADAVDATEPLLQPVWVPWQVVVDHEVGALKVDTLASGVCRKQDLHLRVVSERLLDIHALFAPHAAVNGDHGLLASQQCGDATLEII